MDFLNKATAQLVELFQSMTVGARITTALLVVAVALSFGYLYNAQSYGPEVDLLDGMPIQGSQVELMKQAFGKKSLNSYRVEGTRILIPRGQRASYMAALAEAKALPPSLGSYMSQAAAASSPFETKDQYERRIQVALQNELSLAINAMTGIDSAYVTLDSEVRPGFQREKIVTASVAVQTKGAVELTVEQVSCIRHLVAAAVAGMKPDNVSLTDLTSGHVYHGSASAGGGGDENIYLAVQKSHELSWREKLLNTLSYIRGVTVTPSVVLDREMTSRMFEVKHDPKAVAYSQTEATGTRMRDNTSAGGRVGLAAQAPNTAATLAPARGNSRDEEEQASSKTLSVVSGSQLETEKVGLTPKRVSVSIGVPMTYFAEVWHKQNDQPGQPVKDPDAAALEAVRAAESTRIQQAVAKLLPPAEGVNDPLELVTVMAFQDIRPPAPPAPPAADKVMVWLGEHWSTLGLILLAAFSMAMLRAMIRSNPTPLTAKPLPILTARESEQPAAESKPAESSGRLRRFQASGKSLRDELAEMVTEDPEVAANILKSWIGHVG